jgi:hypothetical protein
MSAKTEVIETFARVAPLGLRFWDALTRSTVGQGLMVTAYRANRPERRFGMSPNSTNTFVLQNINRASEFGLGDEKYWADLPAQQPWVIEVLDLEERFIPFCFEVQVAQRNLYEFSCGSPLEKMGLVPLFSAPSRRVAGGFGKISANLGDQGRYDPRRQTYAPAAWAVIEASYDGNLIGRGVADGQGAIVLYVAYPEPLNPPVVSPPGPRKALTAQEWTIDLRGFYSPGSAAVKFPDLCSVLKQPACGLLSILSPPADLSEAKLGFAQELVLKTDGLSELLLVP